MLGVGSEVAKPFRSVAERAPFAGGRTVMWEALNQFDMPECQNCGAFVTAAYARVFTPTGIDEPRVCPNCEDKIRDGADVREARSTRRT